MESTDNKQMIEFEMNLDRFLKGQMSPNEEQEFKTLLLNNPELKQKAIATARMAKAMQAVGEQRDREVINEVRDSSELSVRWAAMQACGAQQPKARILTFRRMIISFSAAASILLCVFGGHKYYQYTQTTSLGQEYLAYFPASDYSRGEADSVADRLQALYSDIADKKNTEVTIEELSKMWNESRSETFNDFTEYMPELGWMLANAYLIDNEKDKAVDVLDQLISLCPEDTAIGQKSRELKEKIKKI